MTSTHARSLLLIVVALTSAVAHAQPGKKTPGPSAVAAARLAKHPTSNWLAHYLPQDRYKIAGNVWVFVSTNLDTYYHRPDSPLMLEQPADNVIGFASRRDAEEAGYVPDTSIENEGTALPYELPPAAKDKIRQAVREADGAPPLRLPNNSNIPIDESFLRQLQLLSPQLARDARYVKGVVPIISQVSAELNNAKMRDAQDTLPAFIARVHQTRPLFNQTVRRYNRLSVPSRFRKGDRLLRLAFSRMERVFEEVERGVNSLPVLKKGAVTDTGKAMIAFGEAQIEIGKRVGEFGDDMDALANRLQRGGAR